MVKNVKSGLRVAVAGCGLLAALVLVGCGGGSASSDTSSEPATSTGSTSTNSGGRVELDVAKAAGKPDCKTEHGYFVCWAPITNTTDQMGWMSTEFAFVDAEGVRVESDGRFEEYVAAGETYLARHSIPVAEKAVGGNTISVTWDRAQEINTTGPEETTNGLLLPVTDAKIGKCEPSYNDNVKCKVTITNSSSVKGDISTLFAFYNSQGVRVETDRRSEDAIPAGTKYNQDFYGPKNGDAKTKVLSITVK